MMQIEAIKKGLESSVLIFDNSTVRISGRARIIAQSLGMKVFDTNFSKSTQVYEVYSWCNCSKTDLVLFQLTYAQCFRYENIGLQHDLYPKLH